jgi:hypothetical protein
MEKLETSGTLFTLNTSKTVSEKLLSTRYLKYLTNKLIETNNPHDWCHVIASDKESYVLHYFQIKAEDELEYED